MGWNAPQKPIEYAEESLVTAILDGEFGPGSKLPGERELALRLGLTRPTLREALRRLERDGWLTVRQGKSTVVNNFWQEGGLNILTSMVRYQRGLPEDFVHNLLEVRQALAPRYTAAAIATAPAGVVALLRRCLQLPDTAEAFASFDWQLHHALTITSGNPIYTLILNGFAGFYETMAVRYFASREARLASMNFYARLLVAAEQGNSEAAEEISERAMLESMVYWQAVEDEMASEHGRGV